MRIFIVGAGEVGSQIARFLAEEKQDVVVVDRNPARCRELETQVDAAVVVGDGTDPSVLRRAGIESAELVLSVSDNDLVNIVACTIASVLAPTATRLARIRSEAFCQDPRILKQSGIDIAINPEALVVEKIANILQFSRCIDYVEFEEGRIVVIAFPMAPDTPLVGLRLRDVRERYPHPDYLIAMIQRGGHATIPDGETSIAAGDRVYFILRKGDVAALQGLLGFPREPVSHVFIHGGGHVAKALARRLESRRDLSVKLAHPDRERCEELAGELPRALVLHADPTDIAVLAEEYVDDRTVFVAAERDEERNLLSAVLAKVSRPVAAVVGVTQTSSYVPVLTAIGLDVVLCPLNIAVGTILQYLRKWVVVQMGALETQEATVVEFLATERLYGKPIHRLGLPRRVLIGAVLRDREVIIPTGQTRIQPQDRLVIFTERSTYRSLDRFFSEKR